MKSGESFLGITESGCCCEETEKAFYFHFIYFIFRHFNTVVLFFSSLLISGAEDKNQSHSKAGKGAIQATQY